MTSSQSILLKMSTIIMEKHYVFPASYKNCQEAREATTSNTSSYRKSHMVPQLITSITSPSKEEILQNDHKPSRHQLWIKKRKINALGSYLDQWFNSR